MSVSSTNARAGAYTRIEGLIASDECVVLDGGVATELQRVRTGVSPDPERDPGPGGDKIDQVLVETTSQPAAA